MRRTQPVTWQDRAAWAAIALTLTLLLLPVRLKLTITQPLQAVLLAPLRGAAFIVRQLREVQSENRRLGELAAELAIENARLRATAGVAADLPSSALPLVRAPIIARDLATFQRYLIVSRGTEQGIRPGYPAITPAGVVGKVIAVGAHQSLVQTLLATDARISVIDSRSRVPALTLPETGGRLALDYIPKEADVKVNDTVITAGLGGVFPKGLRVGTVVSTPERPGAMFKPAAVAPFVDVATLQEVFIILVPDTRTGENPTGWLENTGPAEVSIPGQEQANP